MWWALLGLAHAGDCPAPIDAACATLALHACGPPAARPRITPPPSDHKAVRDAFGEFPSGVETDNFAIKWGASGAFSAADVDALASALERAWEHQMNALGYPVPEGAEAYKLNVYIGDTGAGTPSSYGNAGYFWYDDDGWPMLVFSATKLTDRSLAARTAAHELFHAVQLGPDPYGFDAGAWWYEATAVWVEAEVWPDDARTASFLYRFAFRPELPLHFFDYPDTGAFEEYHHYGAFVFARYLSEHRGGPDVIRSTLIGVPGGLTPMEVIDGEVGVTDAFFDFTVMNATFDGYAEGARYREWIDHYGGWDSSLSHRPTGTIVGESGGPVQAAEHLPHTYGASYWRLVAPPERARVSVAGAPGPTWSAAVVARTGDQQQIWPLHGSVDIAGLDGWREVWVVVAAVDGFDDAGGYDHTVEVEARRRLDTGGDDTGEAPRACGCRSAAAGAWVWVFALIALRRRR